MAELRTEEEQVQALKNWWTENGKSLLLGGAVALAGIFGWQGWQKQQAAESENASVLYQNLLDAVVSAVGPQQDDAQLSTAEHLSSQLKNDYESTAYANFAAMIMARVAVDNSDLDAAIAELDWVLANQPSESMYSLASLRKARILAAQGELDKALSLVSSAPTAGYAASIAEFKGDLFVAKGDAAKAREQYEVALSKAAVNRPLVQIKLDDLAVEGS